MLYTLVYIIKSSGHANLEETAFRPTESDREKCENFLFAFRMLYTLRVCESGEVGRVGNVETRHSACVAKHTNTQNGRGWCATCIAMRCDLFGYWKLLAQVSDKENPPVQTHRIVVGAALIRSPTHIHTHICFRSLFWTFIRFGAVVVVADAVRADGGGERNVNANITVILCRKLWIAGAIKPTNARTNAVQWQCELRTMSTIQGEKEQREKGATTAVNWLSKATKI